MITELERQFIEVTSRTIRDYGLLTLRALLADRDQLAAMFLGRLLEANGTTLEEIVKAASKSACPNRYADGLHYPNCEDHRIRHFAQSDEPRELPPFDTAAFFAALTVEALSPVVERCLCCKEPGAELAHWDSGFTCIRKPGAVTINDHELVVPPIRIAGGA